MCMESSGRIIVYGHMTALCDEHSSLTPESQFLPASLCHRVGDRRRQPCESERPRRSLTDHVRYQVSAAYRQSAIVSYRSAAPEPSEIAWRAQLRLNRRYRHLSARKLAINRICVAIARAVGRGSPRDRQMKCGNQPADISMIIVANDSRVACPLRC